MESQEKTSEYKINVKSESTLYRKRQGKDIVYSQIHRFTVWYYKGHIVRFLLIILLLYIYNNNIINIFQKKGMPEYQTVNLLIVIIHRFTDSQFYIPFIP